MIVESFTRNGHHFESTTKVLARKAYVNGQTIVLCPSNLQPEPSIEYTVNREMRSETDDKTARSDFDKVLDWFEHDSCISEKTGRHAKFFVETEKVLVTGSEKLLCDLLDCGWLDLGILDDTKYDLKEIVEDLQNNGIKPSLNIITGEIFRKGQKALEEKLEEKICELKSERDDCKKDSEEYNALQKQIKELKRCNTENDIDWSCNSRNSSIWFYENEEIYRKYLADEIEEVEDDMGFEF